ncbi:MAG: NAD-dependent epimerase/dehydratase family protein, partial [Acidimicrobiaceae bacterium]|nr:NAD-dependent epimerase/dehydratase family protein [Acidimicrobiaceae bacterium]
MRALVTGGAGFIGSTLVDRLLAEDHSVDVVDDLSSGTLTNLAEARRDHPRRLSFHRLDIRSSAIGDLMQRRRPDVVYHLAALTNVAGSIADPVDDAEVNLLGALRVIDAARQSGVTKVVFASSADIYGQIASSDLPVRESQPQRPETPHGAAKKAVVDYLWTYRQLHNLEFTALVLPNVYGPRQMASKPGPVVATFVERLLAGEACTLEGNGRQTRDFVYVDDVVDAFARAARRGGGLLLNVGTGIETSVAAVYQVVATAVGVNRKTLSGPRRPG